MGRDDAQRLADALLGSYRSESTNARREAMVSGAGRFEYFPMYGGIRFEVSGYREALERGLVSTEVDGGDLVRRSLAYLASLGSPGMSRTLRHEDAKIESVWRTSGSSPRTDFAKQRAAVQVLFRHRAPDERRLFGPGAKTRVTFAIQAGELQPIGFYHFGCGFDGPPEPDLAVVNLDALVKSVSADLDGYGLATSEIGYYLRPQGYPQPYLLPVLALHRADPPDGSSATRPSASLWSVIDDKAVSATLKAELQDVIRFASAGSNSTSSNVPTKEEKLMTATGFTVTIEATDAAGNAVRTVLTPSASSLATPEASDDSNAWHPDSYKLGKAFAAAHAEDTSVDKRLVFRQFYEALFKPADVQSDAEPFPALQRFQRVLGNFNEKKAGELIEKEGDCQYELLDGTLKFAPIGTDWVDALNTLLFDLTKVNPGFSHAQFMLFKHILRLQDDVKLLSPWFVAPEQPARPW
ncbi:MAG: hypothetical protein Q8S73_23990 [Deltaproteobacteria bacterium]|nr:hypothetical protein [Myxococcales bacterium]MDP3217194.1 hypothetical protein [Deltaproteobacteria bacterium]